jgi:hypothetical protein
MRKIYIAALLVLPAVAGTASADCGGPCGGCCNFGFGLPAVQFNMAARFRLGCYPPGGGVQLGPWYNYWPLEAHFITPAPTGYPYWPQPQTLPPNPVLPPPAPDPKPEVKPVGYSPYAYPYSYQYAPSIYYGTAPSYWYARP